MKYKMFSKSFYYSIKNVKQFDSNQKVDIFNTIYLD